MSERYIAHNMYVLVHTPGHLADVACQSRSDTFNATPERWHRCLPL